MLSEKERAEIEKRWAVYKIMMSGQRTLPKIEFIDFLGAYEGGLALLADNAELTKENDGFINTIEKLESEVAEKDKIIEGIKLIVNCPLDASRYEFTSRMHDVCAGREHETAIRMILYLLGNEQCQKMDYIRENLIRIGVDISNQPKTGGGSG